MKKIATAIAGLAWTVAIAANAATLTVPGQYATIQAAVNAAQNGDEVVVSPGVYAISGQIGIQNNITLRSTFDGNDRSLIETTVIKGPSVNSQPIFLIGADATIRGFTITRDPITVPPNTHISARGIDSGGTNATIDSCIIENCVSVSGPGNPAGPGAAIRGIHGMIQNNIIRNNRADGGAMAACSGIIRNNVFQNNRGGSFAACNGAIANNTFYDEDAVASIAGSTVLNNIMWNSTNNPFVYAGPAPRNCVIKGYTGPGTNIITSDPEFVDAANGDFRLQASSPAIDAGTTATAVSKVDIKGVQRGLKGVQTLRGDGSAIDIGAYEFLPQPIAVWFPGGAPDAIHPGDILSVAWEVKANAGSQIGLALHQDLSPRQDFGVRISGAGPTSGTLSGRTTVTLGLSLPYSGGYAIRGTSVAAPGLTGETPFFTILGLSGVWMRDWLAYP